MTAADARWRLVLRSSCFGAISGFFSTVLLQPLDRLKTLLQDPTVTTKKSSVRVAMAENGVRGLWRGLTPSLLRVVPGVGIYFGTLELLQMSISGGQQHRAPSAGHNLLAGIVARSFAAVALMPVTVVKTRFESFHCREQSIVQSVVALIRQRGYRGLFSGIGPTLIRDAPFSGLYLMFYRKQLEMLPADRLNSSSSASWRFCCGMSAGIAACAVTQPFDMVKTQMQLFPGKYSSLIAAVASLYKMSGVSVFFVGFIPRALRRTLTAALNWTVFDELFKRSAPPVV